MKLILFSMLMYTALPLMAQNDTLATGVYSVSNLISKPSAIGSKKQLLDGSSRDLTNLEIHISTLNPGFKNHSVTTYNDKEELIIVTKGSLKVSINDSAKTINRGGFIFIETGDKQYFENVADSPATYYVIMFRSKNAINMVRGKNSGGSVVKDWNDLIVSKSAKGESRPILNKPTAMFERLDVHVTTLNAGAISHLPHVHRAEEMIILLNGHGEMQLDGVTRSAAVGDVIFVGSNALHGFKNTGSEQSTYFAIQWQNKLKD